IYVGVRRGKFTDIHVMIREQRVEPFVIATLGALLLVATYVVLRAPLALTTLAINLVVNGIVFALLSYKWKVSVHAAAFSASVLIVSLLIDHRLALLYLGLPVIVWA